MTSAVEIRMPAEDREGTAAAVGRWLKQRGDSVEEHEPLLEINTDKVTIEIPAPAAGVLAELTRGEGDAVQPGDVLGRIEPDGAARNAAELAQPGGGEEPRLPPVPASTAPANGLQDEGLSPAVRRLLREHGLNAAQIPKQTRGGRLRIGDVEAFLQARLAQSTDRPELRLGRRVPHTPMRKAIAAHMTRSIEAAPHVTSVFEADLSAVLFDREDRKQRGASAPSVTAYLIRAALAAIRHVPEVNSRWHEDHLELFEWVNFGVGTALDTGGLVVPVIHDANTLRLEQISERLRSLTEKARAGRLQHADMQGGTFTLSNHGVSGSLLAAPIIIPHGQAAILGTGKLQKRPIVCETGGRELFRIRPMMYVTLTVDHRILDGQQTNGFLTRFVAALEAPVEEAGKGQA